MISGARTRKVLSLIVPIIMSLVLAVGFVILPARAADPKPAIEELQEWVDDQGYNYTVAENWITRLSPEEQEALCGLRPVEAPEEPVGGNIRFSSHVPEQETERFGAPPPTYDAWALGYVTPVKYQGACGSCWIFAVCADLESDVAIGESSLLNFSEQELGDCNIWSRFCDGGNAQIAINYFSKYGAADEICNPYAATAGSCEGCPVLRNVDNWRMIAGSGGDNPSQVDTIKNAILNYGPVYSTIYSSDSGFQSYNSGVYEYWVPQNPNHAIQIIGWDDSAGTAGAWMIKNSWGTTWGAGGPHPGCAWVAYGAAELGSYTSAVAGYRNPGDTIYYHDECGWMGWWGACFGDDSDTAYGAVRFTPTQDSTLTTVDFWAVRPGMDYEIKIFNTLNDLGSGNYNFTNQLGSTQSGNTAEAGYYSIALDTPVPLTGGDDFIVQVKFTTAGYEYPVAIDYCTISWLPWSSVANFSDESYFSGGGTQFTKPYNSYLDKYFDVGIRARAGAAQPGQPDLVVSKSVEISGGNFTVSYNVSNIGNATANASTTGKYVNGTPVESQPCPALNPGENYSGQFDPEPCPCGESLNVTVCADNGDAVAESNEANNCEINIVDCPATPDIWVSPSGFNVTLPPNTTQDYTLTIGNDGCAALSYNISDREVAVDCPWLGENPKSGPVGPGASQNITVSINTTGLGSDYSAEIVIASNDPDEDPVIVPVSLHVTSPDLVVEKSVEISGGNFTVSYNVSNIGDATANASTTGKYVNGTLMESQPCPALVPGGSYSGQFDPEPCPCGESLNVTVCADNEYAVAESNEANNCEINIVDCPATPDIWVSPSGFNVTLPPNTTQDYTLTIGNDGCAALSYNISDREAAVDCPWLGENPASGAVGPGASQNISVSINTTGLGSDYTAEIVIASNDPDEDPVIVPVSLHVMLMEGDATLDGYVSIVDALFIAQYEVGLRTFTADQLKCGDSTDDDVVNIVDALHIAQWEVDPDGTGGVLFKLLWESPADDDMLPPEPEPEP